LLEEAFDQMTFLVCMPVFAVALRRNRVCSFLRQYIITDCLRPIGFITQDVAAFDADFLEQRDGMFGIMLVAGTKHKGDRITQTVNKRMNLGIPTALGYADSFAISLITQNIAALNIDL